MNNRMRQMQKLIDEAPVMSHKLLALRLKEHPCWIHSLSGPEAIVEPITAANGRLQDKDYTNVVKGVYFRIKGGYITIDKIEALGFSVIPDFTGGGLVLLWMGS